MKQQTLATNGFEAYRKTTRKGEFRIECGELIRGGYDLCFPVADLYRDRLLPDATLEVAA
jgi:hypothetical protein